MTKDISLPQEPDWIPRISEKSADNMARFHNCTQSILAAFMKEMGIEDPLVIRSAGAMNAGMLSSLTCGIHTAGIMILGLLMGRESLDEGMDGLFPIIPPAQELISRLNKRLGSHSCRELTGVDFTDAAQAMEFVSANKIEKCFSLVREGAEEIGLLLKDLEGRGELFRPGG